MPLSDAFLDYLDSLEEPSNEKKNSFAKDNLAQKPQTPPENNPARVQQSQVNPTNKANNSTHSTRKPTTSTIRISPQRSCSNANSNNNIKQRTSNKNLNSQLVRQSFTSPIQQHQDYEDSFDIENIINDVSFGLDRTKNYIKEDSQANSYQQQSTPKANQQQIASNKFPQEQISRHEDGANNSNSRKNHNPTADTIRARLKALEQSQSQHTTEPKTTAVEVPHAEATSQAEDKSHFKNKPFVSENRQADISYDACVDEEDEEDSSKHTSIELLIKQSETHYPDEWIEVYEKAKRSRKDNYTTKKVRAGRFRINTQHQIEFLPDTRTDNLTSEQLINKHWKIS